MSDDLYSTVEVSCVRTNADGTIIDLGVIGYYNKDKPELNFGIKQIKQDGEEIWPSEQQ